MPKDRRDEIPLQAVNELLYSKNGPVIVSHRRRGILQDIHVTDGNKRLHKPIFRPDGAQALLMLTGQLRTHLESKQLPTDKSPVLPLELDHGYVPEEHGIVADEDLWFEMAEASTEPLTEDRLKAELLHAAKCLLARFDKEELSDIFRAMRLYHLHQANEELNPLVLDGEASRVGRSMGPAKRKEKARALRELIIAIAQEFWRRNPELRSRTVHTAKKITDEVNEAIKCRGLDSSPLEYDTIAKHIRRALKETEQPQL